MRSFDTALEEASWISGGSSRRTMWKIILPMLQPALLAAVTLVIIRALGAFAIPSVLGMPARVDVLTTYIYGIVTTGFLPDYGRAAAVGISVDRKSTRLNSSHVAISYAVFCLKKKKNKNNI